MLSNDARADAEVIVIGAGHNGLICAAYLARAGHDVLLLESRSEVGGLASTVSDLGARFNICNCDHTMIRANPLIDELDLAAFGLSYLEAEPSFINMSWSGEAPWLSFHDVDRTLDGLATTRPDQVDRYRRYLKAAAPVADLMVALAAIRPTAPRLVREVLRRRGAGAATLLRWSRRSAVDVLSEFFDDESMIMPAISVGPTVWGAPPDATGTGLAAAGYAMRHRVHSGRPVGGSGSLTDAVHAAFVAAGGTVRCNTRVTGTLTEAGEARGVVLEGGETLRSRLVIAACDPRIVLGEWMDPTTPATKRTHDRWADQPVPEGYESKVDAVVDALPRYRALDLIADQLDGIDPLHPTTIVSPTLDEVRAAVRLIGEGRVADRPTLLVNFPSVLDPAMQTAEGHHVMSLEALFTPYSLRGGWDGSTEPQRWMDLWAELVDPGYLDHVVASRAMTPERYEVEFEMHRGHTPSYSGSPFAALTGRRREVTRYSTPLPGLMLTGAGTYPGAGVWGASGRNAATVASQRLRP